MAWRRLMDNRLQPIRIKNEIALSCSERNKRNTRNDESAKVELWCSEGALYCPVFKWTQSLTYCFKYRLFRFSSLCLFIWMYLDFQKLFQYSLVLLFGFPCVMWNSLYELCVSVYILSFIWTYLACLAFSARKISI